MKIGFTGTRRGMNELQRAALRALLWIYQCDRPVCHCHHGDCIGADVQFAELCREVWARSAHIVRHPPLDETHRAFHLDYDEDRATKHYFARNRDIVDECDFLIGTPCEMEHQAKGGTWYTLDYAKKKGKTTIIIWPDGKTHAEIRGGRKG